MRPAASASSRRRAIPAARSSIDSIADVRVRDFIAAGAGNGLQPSAWATTRRIARGLLPPTQSGGCGVCTGVGNMRLPVAS